MRERERGVTGMKQILKYIFFFFPFLSSNRSSLLQIYIVKSNSFQINWAQYLGMWLVYRATKHSVSLGTNGLVLETNWVLPGPIIFSNIFLLPKCGTVDFGLPGKCSSLMGTIQTAGPQMSLQRTEKKDALVIHRRFCLNQQLEAWILF